MSFKYGEFEGMRNGRYFTYMNEDSIASIINSIDELSVSEIFITDDVRPDRKEEKWINIFAIKK